MLRKQQSVISLDPIDRRRQREAGFFGRLLKTRYACGKKIKPNLPFGLYVFCGEQGSGKTLSAIWYAERLKHKYEKKGFKVNIWSNTPIYGIKSLPVGFYDVYQKIYDIDEKNEDINIFILDELQVYFPRETKNKAKLEVISQMLDVMGQLRKRRVFVLGVAQIFGRVDKSFREQALYMVNCRKTFTKTKLLNEFIPASEILCDDLGRWSGNPSYIWRHGLPRSDYDTRFIVRV